jgi:arginine-tRNA-protein transferase
LQSIRPDHEELYARYRASIDFEGALSIRESLFGEDDTDKNIFKTKCISVFDSDKLIAGGYFDLGDRSAAAILNFSDPTYKKHSLGKHLMLISVEFIQSHGFETYYPGYVVAGHSKLNYKLFIGREAAQYFEPGSKTWKHFQDTILSREEYSERDKMRVILALLNGIGS